MRKDRPVRNSKSQLTSAALREDAAEILFAAVINFLQKNKLDAVRIRTSVRRAERNTARGQAGVGGRQLRSLLRVYEEMGAIVATWYSNPRFLDKAGNPKALSIGRGHFTVEELVRLSGTNVPYRVVIDLLKRSPTITTTETGKIAVISRFFSLPGFELLRAGLVIERFLETLYRNSAAGDVGSSLIFERSSYADSIGEKKVARLLRDIKQRGTAFMDSVDGQIEANRARASKQADLGELGVFMFAWKKPSSRARNRG